MMSVGDGHSAQFETPDVTAAPPKTRVLLLVEDNPGDAELVIDLLAESRDENYQVVHVYRITDAIERLQSTAVDVVVLDLRLPDCSGVDSVKALHESAGKVPIVVLTGTDDEQLALSCIDAGAQDYLPKSEIRAQNLKRAIGYAITRIREAQLRELQETLERYRALSSASQVTTVTAALAGSGAVSMRRPEVFARLVVQYYALLELSLLQRRDALATSRPEMELIVTILGDVNGGPRDLLDVHVAALERTIAQQNNSRARALLLEARLLALEMMGLLVDYYRVGYRRRSIGGAPP